MDPQIAARRVRGDSRDAGDLPMAVFELFFGSGQEARGGHGLPTRVGWAERIVMARGAEIILAPAQEISF